MNETKQIIPLILDIYVLFIKNFKNFSRAFLITVKSSWFNTKYKFLKNRIPILKTEK